MNPDQQSTLMIVIITNLRPLGLGPEKSRASHQRQLLCQGSDTELFGFLAARAHGHLRHRGRTGGALCAARFVMCGDVPAGNSWF